MYSLLKQYPLQLVFNVHGNTLDKSCKTFLHNQRKNRMFFIANRPHIIRAFKKNCRSTFGRLHIPLAHPNKGLNPRMILHYYWETKAQCTANHCCPRCVGLWVYLDVMKQVLTSALKEEIDMCWVFLGKPNLENDLSLHEKQKKCTHQLANYLDYQPRCFLPSQAALILSSKTMSKSWLQL